MNPKQQILATLLKRTGLFTDAQVEILLGADLTDGLAAAVTRLEMAKESDFLERLAPVLGMAYADLAKTRPTDDALRLLPARAVYQYNALPLAIEDNALIVALNDPLNAAAVDGLRLACGKPVRVRLAPAEDIDKAIKKYYGVGAEAIEKMIEDGRYEVSDTEANISKIDVNEMGQEASIVRFVNQIIAEADRQGATDIHVEPMEDELRIRYRIDGMLHKVDVPPQINRLKAAIISRLKVMANLASMAKTSISASPPAPPPTANPSPSASSKRPATSSNSKTSACPSATSPSPTSSSPAPTASSSSPAPPAPANPPASTPSSTKSTRSTSAS